MGRLVKKRVSFDKDKRALLALEQAIGLDEIMDRDWIVQGQELARQLAMHLARHEVKLLTASNANGRSKR
jgi:hypothetical protein